MIFLEPLRQAVRAIDANPQRWQQSLWGTRATLTAECNTAFCVAGNIAAQQAQVPLAWWNNRDANVYNLLGVLKADRAFTAGELWYGALVQEGDGSYIEIQDFAIDQIVKGDEHSDRVACSALAHMFDGGNDRLEVQEYAEDIARLAGEDWGVPLPDWA